MIGVLGEGGTGGAELAQQRDRGQGGAPGAADDGRTGPPPCHRLGQQRRVLHHVGDAVGREGADRPATELGQGQNRGLAGDGGRRQPGGQRIGVGRGRSQSEGQHRGRQRVGYHPHALPQCPGGFGVGRAVFREPREYP